MNKSNITTYGYTPLNVQINKDIVWLSLNQMVELFERDKSVISRHIGNIYKENNWNNGQLLQKMQQLHCVIII